LWYLVLQARQILIDKRLHFMAWTKKSMVSESMRMLISCLITLLMLLGGTRGSLSAPGIEGTTTPKGIYIPVVIFDDPAEGPPDPVTEDMDWLEYLNYYRDMAGLPPFTTNTSWNSGGWLHSRYMVKNDIIGHSEDPDKPWYTKDGDQAARTSNLVASHSHSASDQDAINLWMQAPFHSVGILDPELNTVGYGSFREEDGGFQMGATLDVLRGLGELPTSVTYPIVWPRDGSTVPLTKHFTEYPSPLSSCAGYSTPVGLPIIIQIGPGDVTPKVTAHSFKQGSEPLEHCIFDETTYKNPESATQSLGRAILGSRDAIVLIPKDPLSPGNTYSVSVSVNGKTINWSFTVSDQADQSAKLSGGELEVENFIIR
jgi:hypothetical protein